MNNKIGVADRGNEVCCAQTKAPGLFTVSQENAKIIAEIGVSE